MENKDYEVIKNQLYILRSVFDSTVDQGMMVIDTNMKIVFYNQPSSIHDLLDAQNIIGKDFSEMFPDTENSAIVQALETGQPVLNRDMYYSTKSGKKLRQLGSAYPIFKGDKVVAAFAVTRFHDGIRQLLLNSMEIQKELFSRNASKSGTRYSFDAIIGNSKAMKAAVRMAEKASQSSSPVLVYGETGTGKELFVQSIHNASVFHENPFVAINCAAIPDNLLESMLFGTKKGAFTGATDSPGIFEQAQNGTLFLDELNSMPVFLQSKLLRVLQEKNVRRLGGTVDIPVNCRIIASCNKPPMECIENGTLRDDLYFRVSVICVNIPPLRERREDIITLAEYFIKKYSSVYGMLDVTMSDEFKEALMSHNWYGNVRELEHAIESAMVMMDPGEKMELHHLNPYIREQLRSGKKKRIEAGRSAEDGSENENEKAAARANDENRASGMEISSYENGNLKDYLLQVEKEVIMNVLEENDWNISKTARIIGYTRSNLQYRMQKLDIQERKQED